jgi:8-oxo-dGTP pyrophosphatase MutT (NUDIX family)
MNASTPRPLPPRPAATGILLRAARDVEVLVIRRHESLAFMGGMWVFPGGALAPSDRAPETLARIPASARTRCGQFLTLQGAPLPPEECLGLTVAAFRETYEETGVMLASHATGARLSATEANALEAERKAVAEDATLFPGLLRRYDLVLDVERLVYWAHWITPSNAPRRFDTRFFLAVAPAEQTARIDTIEAVEHAWMTPAALIVAADKDAMPISQPTLYNLMELDAALRASGSVEALLQLARARRVAPVLPKVMREGRAVMVLPWDVEYAALPGEAAPPATDYPLELRALPSRMLFNR